MRKIRTSIYVLIALLLPGIGFCGLNETQNQNSLKSKMLEDLDVIKNTFEVKYAPAEWKKIYADWDLKEQIDIAKAKVLSTDQISIKKYQQILKSFFNSTCDYHVGVHFYSTAASFLPFRVQSAGNRYFIAWVDSASAPSPLAVGDEVISFGGKPIHDVVKEIQKRELGNPGSLTDQGFSELYLTIRVGRMGHEIPTGNVPVKVKHQGSDKATTYHMEWYTVSEDVGPGPFKAIHSLFVKTPGLKSKSEESTSSNEFKGLLSYSFMQKKMISSSIEPIQAACDKFAKKRKKKVDSDDDQDSPLFLNSKYGVLPPLGNVIWEAPSHYRFRAYLYENADKKVIGYIRIAHYLDDDEAVRQFATLVRAFEKKSDALVIDQLNNAGGYLFYMYELASILSPQPLKVPTQRVAITQEDVYSAFSTLEVLNEIETQEQESEESESPLSERDRELLKGAAQYFRFLINEWNEGRNFTTATYLYGIEAIKPHPRAQYTKPILLLINSMDFSCADFFPAVLQDNKRATLMGTRTAGAGGFVLSQQYQNSFGVMLYTFTASIAERIDNNPIENLGVFPDIQYELTPRDLQSGYVDYLDAIHNAVDNLLKK